MQIVAAYGPYGGAHYPDRRGINKLNLHITIHYCTYGTLVHSYYRLDTLFRIDLVLIWCVFQTPSRTLPPAPSRFLGLSERTNNPTPVHILSIERDIA